MTDKPNATILIVDDDDAARYAITRLLCGAGYEVIEAANGRDTLRLAKRNPDLMVLDVNLPDIDGFEVCRRIKSDPATSMIPVVHLSATYQDDESKVTGLESGADGYLTYPVEPKVLIAYVRALLRTRDAEAHLTAATRQWEATFDAMNEDVCLVDKEQRVLRCNAAMTKLLSKPYSEIIGSHCWEVMHGTTAPVDECPFRHMMENGTREEFVFWKGDRCLHHAVDPVIDEAGRVQGAVQIFSDITERKRAEEALRKSEQELNIRNRIAEIFLTTPDDKVYGEVLEVVLEVMQSKFGTFAYINEKGERVVPSMTRGIWDECKIRGKTIVFPRETWGSNLWARCIIEKKTISSNGPFKVPEGHVAVTRAMAAPIIHRGEVVGNFMVGNKATEYDEKDVALFQTIADHVAPILKSRLHAENQSRERRKIEGALRRERDNFINILNSMKDGVYIVNQRHEIEYVNPVLIEQFGHHADKRCYEYFHDLKEECPWCKNREVFSGKTVRWQWYSPKTQRTYDLIDTPLATPDGGISKLEIFRDVTQLKQSEEELRKARDELEMRFEERTAELVQTYEALWETERRYEELWDHAPVAYHILDSKGTIIQVNETEMNMLGFSRDEMVGKPIFDFILPEQRKEAEERFRLKIAGEHVPKKDDRIYAAKDGSKINVFIDDVMEYDSDGNVIGVRTTMIDITEKKLAETELKRLSSRLLEVQENERKRISRDLHDSIGQALAAIKFGVENAAASMHEGPTEAITKSFESLISLVQEATNDVRRIHTDLRPSLLDDIGIISTISWFCREFEKLYTGIRIESNMNIEEDEVPEPLKIVVFRILQEALNNVAKHSKADLVRISMKGKGGKIDLLIQDNGKGFDFAAVQSAKSGKQGVGLMSMRERAEFSRGSFAIESTPGSGTRILVSWQ